MLFKSVLLVVNNNNNNNFETPLECMVELFLDLCFGCVGQPPDADCYCKGYERWGKHQLRLGTLKDTIIATSKLTRKYILLVERTTYSVVHLHREERLS